MTSNLLICHLYRTSSTASKSKVLQKKSKENFRRTTSFSSSEDESPEVEKAGSGNHNEIQSSHEDNEETPTIWKCDIKIEKLHKNIVNHKHNQYKTWLDKEEEIKQRKEKEESTKPKLSKIAKSPKSTKNVKSKSVLPSRSDEDSDSDDILSKFKDRIKKIKFPEVQSKVEENKVTSLNKSPIRAESHPSPDKSLKPTFSDSDSEEENQNELVDMLFDMINDEDPNKEKKYVQQTDEQVLMGQSENTLLKNKQDEANVESEVTKENWNINKIHRTETETEFERNILPSILDNPDLKNFFFALKMTMGFDIFEKQLCQEGFTSHLETLVDKSLLQLNFLPPDVSNEDKKYMDEHCIKMVQVNVGNIRKDDNWSDQNEECLQKFEEKLRDRICWTEILKTGLSNTKAFLHTLINPVDSKEVSPDCFQDNVVSSPKHHQIVSDKDATLSITETEKNSATKSKEISKGNEQTTLTVNDENAGYEESELPEPIKRKRDGSVSSDDTITISRRSRKSSGSSTDMNLPGKSKKSDTVRRSISSDDEVKVNKIDRERSASSSSDISVRDLVKASTKKRTFSESSDDSIVITRKEKGKLSDRKSGHRDQKSAEKSSKHSSHHTSDSHQKKKKHKKDRDREKHEKKAIDLPGFKIPKSDQKDKERSKEESTGSKKDHAEEHPKHASDTLKVNKKQVLEKIVEKSHARDPAPDLGNILSSMSKLSKSSKKKHREKKKKRDRDKHRDKDSSNTGIGDSDDDELPMPVPAANDDDDLPLPVSAGTDCDEVDLPTPVPADGQTTLTETRDDADDHYVEDLPDQTDDAMDTFLSNPSPAIKDIRVGDCFDIPRPDSACSVSSTEDTSYVSNFPKPVKGVQRRSQHAPTDPSTRLNLPGYASDTQEPGPKDSNAFRSPPRNTRKAITASPGYDGSYGSPGDFIGTENCPDDLPRLPSDEGCMESQNRASSSKSKPKPILKEKRETEVSHFSRAKVSFNVSDSDVERTDSDRSRTPSPFLSTNKYYPWLYSVEGHQEEGIHLESIKIDDQARIKDKTTVGKKKQPKINFESLSKKDNEKKRQVEAEEREKNKGLGKFLDKVISSLKTHNPPAKESLPPLPPSPPRPVPSPYDPSQATPGKLRLAPPPPPPPEDVSPDMIPLPPSTPRYESPEPGEITEETEAAQSKLVQLRQTWGRHPRPRDHEEPWTGHQRQSRRAGNYEDSGRGKRKSEEETSFGRKRRDELNNKRFHGRYGGGIENYGMLNSYPGHQSAIPFDAESESSWLDKFLIAWQELISNQEYYIRRDLSKNEPSTKTPADDLGSAFNEPKLNTRICAQDSGEERALYTCDTSRGAAQFTCSVCDVTVTGIRVLQSHMGGRKHIGKLSEYKVLGIFRDLNCFL